MIYQELIIDGVSLDLYDDTDITLEITSNVFNDITEITTNRSYTVSLPKTVRNLTLIGNCDKVGTNTDAPYTFHDCEYRRNGVPIIRHGRASVEECEDDISVCIYWGLFPFLEKLIEEDKNLNELSNDLHILFEKKLTPYDQFMEDGYGYADYNPVQFAEDDGSWVNDTIVQNPETKQYELVDGKIYTGTEVGGSASGNKISDENYECLVVPFVVGNTAVVRSVVGQGDYRGYAVIDANANVLLIADEATTEGTIGGDINHTPDGTFATLDYLFYIMPYEVTVTKFDIRTRTSTNEVKLHYGIIDAQTHSIEEWGEVTIPASQDGITNVTVGKLKPADKYFYVRQENTAIVGYEDPEGKSDLSAYNSDLDEIYEIKTSNACFVTYYDSDTLVPEDYNIQAPVTAAKLIVNNDKRYSENPSVTVSGTEQGTVFNPIYGHILNPTVTCQWILDQIEQDYNINIDLTQVTDFIKNLAVPLINRESDGQTIGGSLICVINPTTSLGVLTLNPTSLPTSVTVSSDKKTLNIVTDCKLSLQIQATVSFSLEGVEPTSSRRVTFDGVTYVYNEYLTSPDYIIMTVHHKDEDAEDDKYYIGDEGGRVIYDTQLIDMIYTVILTGVGEIDFVEGDSIEFELYNEIGHHQSLELSNGLISASPLEGDEVPVGGMFPIVKNLPEISVTDYLKTLSLLSGTFPLQQFTDNTVKFVTYDTIWGNKDKALDWSSNLIAAGMNNKPRQIEYSVDGYCQHNYYKWKDDDQTKGNYDADMEIKNETLEAENDAFELPFAASDGERVPIYTSGKAWTGTFGGSETVTGTSTTTTTGSVSTYSACEPRLMNIIENSDGEAALDFQINLPEIFATKYANIISTITKAVIITEYVRLSDIEILNFDETVPVYLAQYGAYFAVLSIKVLSDGYSEVKMIRIEL